ncbi:MAG: glucose 1-dehydrogenase, partial [Planctomycetes bacterium]|nr:glucose 1-dehydrogenase [Planctomycetota bacterium]
MDLRGKVAVITGGSKGIGLGCARVFAKYGATVVIGARGEEAGRAAERELCEGGHRALFVATDVTRQTDMQALLDAAVQRFERLDCMINNAGWHPPAETYDQVSVDDFEALLRLNLTSTYMGCKFALPHLLKTGGSLINMASEAGIIGQGEAVRYVTTKAGQIGLTKALALDLAPQGVRVNAVCPAGVRTPLLEAWAESQFDPQEAITTVNRAHPLGRMATIEEIGEVCAFLASDSASFITG